MLGPHDEEGRLGLPFCSVWLAVVFCWVGVVRVCDSFTKEQSVGM